MTDDNGADHPQQHPQPADPAPPADTGDEQPPENPDEPADDADEHADEGDQDDGSSRSSREKRYRLRLREAERERDELRTQLDALRQSIVDDIAEASGLPHPELLGHDHELTDFIADDGTVDRDKVTEAAAAAVQKYHIRAPKTPKPNQQQGTGGGRSGGQSSWSGALKGQ